MSWYKTLSIHQKINVKDCFGLLTGISFQQAIKIFSFKETITILYNKLKIEG